MNAQAITQSSATIGGRTNHPSAVRAEYTLTPNDGVAPASTIFAEDNNLNRFFSTTVTGLRPATSYTFQVRFFSAGNMLLGTSAGDNCPFTTPPATFECIDVASITPTGAIVTGSTSHPAATRATFLVSPAGGTAPDDTTPTAAANQRLEFSSQLTGLTPSTAYTVRVQFYDGNNLLGTSAVGGCPFNTPSAPTYVCINATGITTSSAVLGGSTSNQSVTQARFTLSPAVGASIVDTSATPVGGDKQFFVTANGLAPGTNYSFLVEFLDAQNNVVGSNTAGDRCPFTTLHLYECVVASAIGPNSATVGGSTTNLAASQARFTLTPAVGRLGRRPTRRC